MAGVIGRNCAHPELMEIASDNLCALVRQERFVRNPYWDAWRESLDRPLEEVLQLRIHTDSRATK